ncbi:ATP-binding protein [Patescibacteria group bacterium]|jgi:predicted kinase|nr:ATP-binding protein [Patescibacteria group bacterium]
MHVILLRGISGSGKSTWIKNNQPQATVVSADHLFIQPDGSYKFDQTRLGEAHQKCFKAFIEALQKGSELIIVDNTNVTAWEMSPYIIGARAFGATVEIMTFDCDPEVAIARKDWVPADKVRQIAKILAVEEKNLPRFMQEIHKKISC